MSFIFIMFHQEAHKHSSQPPILSLCSIDGLYILCTDETQLPKHLLAKVNEGPPRTSSYRWHPANGSTRPSAFRMRNCYRFNNAGVRVSGVRGYLWTKVCNDKESLQYRLLHVFPNNEPIVERTLKPSTRKDTNGKKIKTEKPRKKRRKPTNSIREQDQDENRPQDKKRSGQGKIARQGPSMSAAPTATLTEADVRAVFESIHRNRKPPPHLAFQVIAVEANSPKVTPPQFLYQGTNVARVAVHSYPYSIVLHSRLVSYPRRSLRVLRVATVSRTFTCLGGTGTCADYRLSLECFWSERDCIQRVCHAKL